MGDVISEPLDFIASNADADLAIYAKENKLLEQPGWIHFLTLAGRKNKLLQLVKQAQLRSFRTAPKYMYGFQIPKDYDEAIKFDSQNSNSKWSDSTALEMAQLMDYDTFIDKGEFHKSKVPNGFKKITMHLVYVVKHDGRFKCHLTDIPIDWINF